MRILQLCHKPPYPKRDGGCMAMAAITEGLLAQGHEVKVLCMSTHRHPISSEDVPKEILSATAMEAVQMDVRINPWGALINLFSSESYNISRFYSDSFEQRLNEILQKSDFDVVHLESLFCAPYLPLLRKHGKKVVLRAHNVEHLIWQRLAQGERNPIKRAYLNLLTDRLRAYEWDTLNRLDGIVTITKEDAELMRTGGIRVPMVSVPMGLDVSSVAVKPLPEQPLRLYHVGSMDWQPNLEAVSYFVEKIWPLLHRELPEVSCHFAGRGMPKALLNHHAPPLHIQGEVSSVSAFAEDKQVMVVPLLSGGGMRIKIVEAMAMGKVVLSTSVGAEGIPYTDGEHLLIADTPHAFVEHLKALQEDFPRMERIGKNARELAEQEFDLKKVTNRLSGFYSTLVE